MNRTRYSEMSEIRRYEIGDEVVAIKSGLEGLALRGHCEQVFVGFKPSVLPKGQKLRNGIGLNPYDSGAIGVGPFDYLEGDRGTIIGIHDTGTLDVRLDIETVDGNFKVNYYQVNPDNWALFDPPKEIPEVKERPIFKGRTIELEDEE